MRKTIALLFFLLSAMPVSAQTKASDKDWNAVVDAAKKEGKVVVAGSPDPVMRNDSEITARVKTERSSGIFSVDVYLAGPDTTAVSLYGEKIIDPVRPLLIMPEVADGAKWKRGKIWFADPEERYAVRAFNSVATFLFINTDQRDVRNFFRKRRRPTFPKCIVMRQDE